MVLLSNRHIAIALVLLSVLFIWLNWEIIKAKKYKSLVSELETANNALLSEIEHYQDNNASEQIKSALNYTVPELGGSLLYKIAVIEVGERVFMARLTSRVRRALLIWNDLATQWDFILLHTNDGTEETREVISCDFEDSEYLQKQLNRLMK